LKQFYYADVKEWTKVKASAAISKLSIKEVVKKLVGGIGVSKVGETVNKLVLIH
jgi:hypothetical protein